MARKREALRTDGRTDGRTYTEPRPIYVSRRGRQLIKSTKMPKKTSTEGP